MHEMFLSTEDGILSVIRSKPDGATHMQIARKLHAGMHRTEYNLDKLCAAKKITLGTYNRYVEVK